MKSWTSGLCVILLSNANGCVLAPAPERACTLIGCSDGLNVVVENAPATPYSVEVVLPDGSSRTGRCEFAGGCTAGVFIEGVSAEEVTVRIIGSGGTSSQVVRPAYLETQPNGPDCPPICRQARVEVRYDP